MASPGRRSNGTVLERARTLQRRPTLPSAKKGERVQDTFPTYEDFPWAKIEEFLGQKFPHWDFRPMRVRRVFILQYSSLIVCAVPRQMGL